nr:MFS transporter [Cellulosimicrobium sp. CUA-896]
MTDVQHDPTTARTQRRTLATLAAAQVLAGIGVATGLAVSSLVASELSGSDAVAGLTQTSAVVGAAVVALPLARIAARAGRRRSIATGLAVAAAGAVLATLATWWGSWPLLVVAMLAFGAGSAAGLAARFAATDLATPARRATDLSVVVWATTVGSVLGPTLAGVADEVGASLAARSGLPGPAHGAAHAPSPPARRPCRTSSRRSRSPGPRRSSSPSCDRTRCTSPGARPPPHPPSGRAVSARAGRSCGRRPRPGSRSRPSP